MLYVSRAYPDVIMNDRAISFGHKVKYVYTYKRGFSISSSTKL